MEIKNWSKNIGVGMAKNGCCHSGLRTQNWMYIKVLIEWTDFWYVDKNSEKSKVLGWWWWEIGMAFLV